MTLDTLFEIEFRKAADKRVEFLRDELLNINAITDYGKYMHLVGRIGALRDIVPDLCDETSELISKR